MSEPRRHHILPITYQKQFTEDGVKLWTWDKKVNHIYCSNPKNISVRRDYNTALSNSLELDHSTAEGFFSKLETDYPKTVNLLINQTQSKNALDHAIKFMAMQFMRSPISRNLMSQLILALFPNDPKLWDALGLEISAKELIKRARGGDKEAITKIGLQSSGYLFQGASRIFEKLFYRVVLLDGEHSLISGDNSVIYFGLANSGKKLTPTIASSQYRVLSAFPLSPRMFLFGDSKAPPLEAFTQFAPPQKCGSPNLVKYFNRTIALTSDQYVISSNEELLRRTVSRLPKSYSLKDRSPDILAQLAKELLKLNHLHWGEATKFSG